MKRLSCQLIILGLLMLITVACQAELAAPVAENPAVSETATQTAIPVATATVVPVQPGENLPVLPSLHGGNTNGIGNPLPGGAEDPFQAAEFILDVELPAAPETAVVEQHSFGELDEAKARALADRFGFTGPLYIQRIDPQFAPAEEEEMPLVFTAFDGQRLLNISDTGVTYEDRGVLVDYDQQPDFTAVKPIVEAQLQEWGLLDFPYELQQLPAGQLVVYRLIDGIRIEQNAFNFFINQDGEFAYFDYQPLRTVTTLGNYPLQTAVMAWEQLQTANGRAQARYDLLPPPESGEAPDADFVNPRSWGFPSEPGQEVHLYMTPAVYEATDGSGLHLMYGNLTLAGDEQELTEIAAHLADVLHVWGTVGEENGAKTVIVDGWEKLPVIQYETLEGTITQENGQAVLQTVDGETFILAAVPADLPESLEAYVNITAKRDVGAAYPVIDWMSINEKVVWPDAVEVPAEEWTPVQTVTIESASLIYFTLHQTVDSTDFAAGQLFVPVWKFTGTTDQNRPVTFWVTAVAQDNPSVSSGSAGSGSINGWVWHDLCDSGQDGRPAPTSAPAGCIASDSPLGAYRADGIKDAQEPLLAGLVVQLGQGACPAVGLAQTTTIDTDMSYSFSGLAAGTYCVSINPSEEPNLILLRPGVWTYPALSEGTIGTTVILEEGQNIFDINFGWDHQFLPQTES